MNEEPVGNKVRTRSRLGGFQLARRSEWTECTTATVFKIIFKDSREVEWSPVSHSLADLKLLEPKYSPSKCRHAFLDFNLSDWFYLEKMSSPSIGKWDLCKILSQSLIQEFLSPGGMYCALSRIFKVSQKVKTFRSRSHEVVFAESFEWLAPCHWQLKY